MDTIELPPRTHNEPPLAELLPEETAELQARARQLVDSAGRAVVTDEEGAVKATLLAGMIKDHLSAIDEARETRKRPFLEAGRTVDAHFNGIAGQLASFDPKRRVIGGPLHTVLGLVDSYRRQKEAEAAAERRRLEEEARKQRAAAEAAAAAQREAEDRERRAREEADRRVREAEAAARSAVNAAEKEKAQRQAAEAEAARQGEERAAQQRQLDAEIERRAREEEAARLERQAAETVAAPINTGFGVKATRRTVWRVEIDDLKLALRHCLKVDEAALRACVQQVFDRQVKAGVRVLPGARVLEDSATTIRR